MERKTTLAIIVTGLMIIAFSLGSLFSKVQGGTDSDEMVDENLHNQHESHDIVPILKNPSMPGQAGFGAIQEIINLLEEDKETDWENINMEALRNHLIDMNELTLNAEVEETVIENGLKITVTGQGRTINAIHNMVPTHVNMTLSQFEKWDVSYEKTDNGVIMTALSNDPDEVYHIRGLGFIGLMATGANHPQHHLMMAKGEMH